MGKIGSCLAALALVLALAVPALAGDGSDRFELSVIDQAWGKAVTVRYRHEVFGWVDAGRVEFHTDGRIVVKARGEDAREVTDLAGTLSGYAGERLGDPSVGSLLALRIERRVGR